MYLTITKILYSLPFMDKWIAQQFRAPSQYNPLGWLAQNVMRDGNAASSAELVARLKLQADNDQGVTVLELGPGNGLSIQALLETKACQKIYAVEISDRFRRTLSQQFAQEIADGLLSIHATDAKSLKFLPDASVDAIFGGNVLYFLHPLPAYLQELRRVAKPGAPILFGVADIVKGSDPDTFVNTDWDVCMQELRKAGFDNVAIDPVQASSPFDTKYISARAPTT